MFLTANARNDFFKLAAPLPLPSKMTKCFKTAQHTRICLAKLHALAKPQSMVRSESRVKEFSLSWLAR